MTTLLYAVVSSCDDTRRDWAQMVMPPGVNTSPVRLVDGGGLGAAVSTVSSAEMAPTVVRALAYARVVEAIHAALPTIPMRYGCVFRDERDLLASLAARRQKYVGLLSDVGGCVEMSLRLLVGEAARDEPSAPGPDVKGDIRPSGTAYLESRRLRHQLQSRPIEDARRRLEVVRTQLSGYYVKCRVESPPDNTRGGGVRLLTAHFLMAREVVAGFRAACQSLHQPQDAVLTGPWPPYNFVE